MAELLAGVLVSAMNALQSEPVSCDQLDKNMMKQHPTKRRSQPNNLLPQGKWLVLLESKSWQCFDGKLKMKNTASEVVSVSTKLMWAAFCLKLAIECMVFPTSAHIVSDLNLHLIGFQRSLWTLKLFMFEKGHHFLWLHVFLLLNWFIVILNAGAFVSIMGEIAFGSKTDFVFMHKLCISKPDFHKKRWLSGWI